METIKISVIVPVYKVPEEYLRKCIESILNQSLKELEIILVDDGSPDNCGNICDEYAKKDSRINVIHKENEGVSSARNIGISKARGKYISFVDSDDWIENDFYEKIFEYAIDNDVDIAISGFLKEINGKSHEVLKKEKSQIFTRQEAQYRLLDRKIYVWGLWDKIYKTKLIKGKVFFDKTLDMGEDLDFVWKILKVSEKIGYISLNKYHYVKRKNSATLSANPEKKWSSIQVIKNILDEIIIEKFDEKSIKQVQCLYVKEVASSIIDMINSNTVKYEKYIKLFQKEIKNYREILFKNSFSIKVKVGLFLAIIPYDFYKLIKR